MIFWKGMTAIVRMPVVSPACSAFDGGCTEEHPTMQTNTTHQQHTITYLKAIQRFILFNTALPCKYSIYNMIYYIANRKKLSFKETDVTFQTEGYSFLLRLKRRLTIQRLPFVDMIPEIRSSTAHASCRDFANALKTASII